MEHIDALTVGETMVLVTPVEPGPISTDREFVLRVGGAESNVAGHLSRLGHTVAWASAVGDDPFGSLIRAELARIGVDVSRAAVEPGAPTGVYFKHIVDGSTRVLYYRTGSAASRIGTEILGTVEGLHPRLLHVTGVTAALSPSCLELVEALVCDRRTRADLVSFDVNYRPALWSAEVASPALLDVARAADIVFVGLDEAHELWGVADPAGVRRLLPAAIHLVVKDHDHEATEFAGDEVTREPAHAVAVVESVGAGDAFAAGWLSGMLRGADAAARLRLGHEVAARVLATTSDDVELSNSRTAASATATGVHG